MASVRTATAPREIASEANCAPWTFSPGRAIKRSPGKTESLAWEIPLTSILSSSLEVESAPTMAHSAESFF